MPKPAGDSIDRSKIKELVEKLGPTLVAVSSGTRQRHLVEEWINGSAVPAPEEYSNILFALEIFLKIAEHEGDDIARAWFTAQNIGELTPYLAIRSGKCGAVERAARRFINDEYYA